MRLLACLAFVRAWPSDLLKHECAKGELLVAGGFAPPPIMGAIPEVDGSMLVVRAVVGEGADDDDDDDELEGELFDGATVAVGDRLELRYVSTRHPPTNTHLVFVSSSGEIDGGERCGSSGAHLHCSTCGESPAWMNRAVWTATTPGDARLAVGAARGGFGTPAVRVAIRTVNVTVRASAVATLAEPAAPILADARGVSAADALLQLNACTAAGGDKGDKG